MIEATSYLPTVAWRITAKNIVLLDSNVGSYRVDIKPVDINEPGAEHKVIGNYLKDFVGHTYRIISANGSSVDVVDDFKTGFGPQTNRTAIIYRSVGNGDAPYLAPIWYRFLDKSAFDYSRRFELDILWKNRNSGVYFIGHDNNIREVINEEPIGDVDGFNTDFTVEYLPDPATLRVYLNGVRQFYTNYSVDNQTIVFLEAPFLDDEIRVSYKELSAHAQVIGEIPSGIINGSNDELYLEFNPIADTVKVYLNGILQLPSKYVIDDNKVTFVEAPYIGDIVSVDYKYLSSLSSDIYNEDLSSYIDGSNVSFELSNDMLEQSERVYLNGVRQLRTIHYDINNNALEFYIPPHIGDKLIADYKISF